ncbi:helix-turn-helix transcriptional regulator [Mesorhizobium sp.]|uniref:helix-turn-helix transcriptional regulator n=1 Tax=Mesorhizobium sp. TaxID=1871066 RepID=UPI0025B82219|nr:helix-turn-helix transcriptional regulator [Mesorhizobium sp.]
MLRPCAGDDPGLNAGQISRKFRISERYVRQLFAEEGTSFSDYVNGERLAYVHSCLSDRRQLLRRIADIAFEVGFTEPSTFYRQFRLRYGVTPTEVRALVEKDGNGTMSAATSPGSGSIF